LFVTKLRRILARSLAVLAVVVLAFIGLAIVSLHWPWLDVTLRASPALTDAYRRCSHLRPGQSVSDVMSAMQGLEHNFTKYKPISTGVWEEQVGSFAKTKTITFFTRKHSADLCQVEFTKDNALQVALVTWLPD
jgi:hypothetical protein